MKTSKIILFSYIGLIAVAFLIFVIYLRHADNKYRREAGKYTTIEKDIPSFKYIYTDGGVFINLLNDDRTFITVSAQEKYNVSEINFSVSNDTLFVHPTNNTNSASIHLKHRSSLNLVSNNAKVFINGFNTDTLNYLAMAKSEISGFNNNSNITVVNATLTESKFNAYQGSIDQLNLKSVKSSTNIRSKMSAVSANMKDNSDVRLGNCDKIDLEKDESSKFYCYP